MRWREDADTLGVGCVRYLQTNTVQHATGAWQTSSCPSWSPRGQEHRRTHVELGWGAAPRMPVIFVFKQITSGLVFLQTQAPGEGTRQTQTCDRQAVCPRAVGLQTPTLSGETRAQLFTAVGPQARPSSGSARSATCRRGGATHGSPQTGWCGAGPARQCTA